MNVAKTMWQNITWNPFLDIVVDGTIQCYGQIAHTRASFFLCLIQAGGMLQVLLSFVRVFLLAEIIVPRLYIALRGDRTEKFSHRFRGTASRIIANTIVHLLQALALFIDFGYCRRQTLPGGQTGRNAKIQFSKMTAILSLDHHTCSLHNG